MTGPSSTLAYMRAIKAGRCPRVESVTGHFDAAFAEELHRWKQFRLLMRRLGKRRQS